MKVKSESSPLLQIHIHHQMCNLALFKINIHHEMSNRAPTPNRYAPPAMT